MRQTISSGSVKAIFLNREEALKRLNEVSGEAMAAFPQINEIRLFGSLAKGEETGLSDMDIFIFAESEKRNPLERMRPYFAFFSERLDMAIDMIVATLAEKEHFEELLKESVLIGKR